MNLSNLIKNVRDEFNSLNIESANEKLELINDALNGGNDE